MTDHVSDAMLLERFVRGREEAAFTALVRRHAPVVRSVCRRILACEHDAEDVVQATFLVLARNAGEITWRESVGGWLCGVARRQSLHARAGVSRRERRETSLAGIGETRGGHPIAERFHPQTDPLVEVARRDLCRVVDQELQRLPEKYREPVVLCDLEGLTHEEAARRLGLPAGSMSRRLGRARALLRQRLVGRGLPMAIGLLLAFLVPLVLLIGAQGLRRTRSAEVRLAMTPFKIERTGRERNELQGLLNRLEKAEDPQSLRGEALAAARDADRLSGRLEGLYPAPSRRQEWRSYTASLSTTSASLASLDDQADLSSLLLLTRRMNDVCVRCHLAFRR